ncbi:MULTISPECIES: restriction endonuclease subunit S [Pantoea]|jgi:type I restriction enzyme S subunit|uniref:restriction endonuclease subunit S n=1 Tax=Pantoea TaxID=53335 RepID=UPI00142D6E97|nr:restriction endonuclease subunit S [Pantoea sp. EKM20T]KAF6682208.1 restriction endonuclease subunit S [Pantoea sp. EKM20T]
MSSKFRKVKLKDITTFKYGKTIRKQDIQSYGEYPVFSGYQVVGYLPDYMYKEEQLIIVCRGAGGTGDIKMSPSFCSITNLAIIISCDETVIDKGYLYWKLLFSDTYSLRTGSAQPQITINSLESFEIEIETDVSRQRKIASELFDINNKIRNNFVINQILEQMAQALFKSWFVDFEPVKEKIAVLEAGGSQEDATLAAMTAISGKDDDALVVFEHEHPEQYAVLKATAELFPSAMQDSELGEIPMGWNVLPLESATSLIIDHRGKTPKKLGGDWSEDGYPAISAKNIKNGRLVRHDAIKYVDAELYTKWMRNVLLSGDILMTSEAPLGELLYLAKNSNYLLSQRLYGIRADNNIVSGCYLYLWLQSARVKDDINGRATGSTVVGIRQSELKKVNVMAPKKALIESFSSLAAYYLAKIESNEKENIVLENLRDTLLPKLLSGEITLPEAEQAVREVESV